MCIRDRNHGRSSWPNRWLVERSRFHCKLINREISCVLLLSLANSATKPAVLTHRAGEVSLDNAFSLIEGHPRLFRALGLPWFCEGRFPLRPNPFRKLD